MRRRHTWFTLAWCFYEKERAEAERLLTDVNEWRVLAPGLWEMEVVNGLAMAERRERLTAQESAQFLAMRDGAALASFDEQLRKAAKKAGVEVWARAVRPRR